MHCTYVAGFRLDSFLDHRRKVFHNGKNANIAQLWALPVLRFYLLLRAWWSQKQG